MPAISPRFLESWHNTNILGGFPSLLGVLLTIAEAFELNLLGEENADNDFPVQGTDGILSATGL